MFLEVSPADGPIGVVSQSGGMSAMAYGLLRGRGLGVRHVHATGNEADVGVSELAWAVAHDPAVKLLLLYLENIAHPELLARTAAYARERDLPIVAVKAGRSEAASAPPPRTPARWPTRTARSMPSSAATASGAYAIRMRRRSRPRPTSRAGGPRAGGWWWSATRARAA